MAIGGAGVFDGIVPARSDLPWALLSSSERRGAARAGRREMAGQGTELQTKNSPQS